MDQNLNQVQQLAAQVSRSIVSVEWTTIGRNQISVVSTGCILHKSANNTYILTSCPDISNRRHSVLVRFHDNQVGIQARVLIRPSKGDDNKLAFVVLRTEGSHENNIPIQFRYEPLTYSKVLCVVAKTRSNFHKIEGLISTPSCAAHDIAGTVPEITNDHFIFICEYEDTEIMKSAAVFHENGHVNGFVIEDCSLPLGPEDKPGDELIDREAKICVRPRHLEAWLQKHRGNDWRTGLEKKKI